MRYLINRSFIVLLFLGLIPIIHSCKKHIVPTLETATVTNITGTTATSGGNITDEGSGTIVERGICWSNGITPTIADSRTIEGGGAGTFVSNMSDLDAATTYYVRAYATNEAGNGYGMAMSFTTLGQAPSATTQTATNITSTSATLNGKVNPNYLSTTVTFDYGTTTSYGQTLTATQSPVTGNSNTDVTAELSGLTAGTIYHFRVKTVNSLGTTNGNDMSFTTLGQAPTAVTQAACCLSSIGAKLNGTVNANYLSTSITFEYGLTSAYSNSIAAIPSPVTGNANTNVSVNISGLIMGTTYHFRIKAVNSLGTTYGNDMSFTTLVIDIDGNIYNVVTIGTQVWMAENLRTTTYNDEESIPYGWPLDSTHSEWNFPTTPGYCWYNDEESYKIPHGALYNQLVVNTGKLCPTGWHVPTTAEWNILLDFLWANRYIYADGSYDIVKSIASTSGWKIPQPVQMPHDVLKPVLDGAVGNNQETNNSTGFNGYPSGHRSWTGTFIGIGWQSVWWSSGPGATGFQLLYDDSYIVDQVGGYERYGHSVRCIKD